MEIVIVGAGKVGELLSIDLANEGHDITLIDKDAEKVENLIEIADIKGVVGNGAVLAVQEEADVSKCQIFIAVTPEDETNIMATIIAKKIGAAYCIARVRNPEYVAQMDFVHEELGISLMINPEQEAAREIMRSFDHPYALSVSPFSQGKINIVKIRVLENSQLAGQNIAAIRGTVPDLLFCIVKKNQEVLIPNGQTIIDAGDEVYVTGTQKAVDRFNSLAGENIRRFRSALVIGGGRIARYLLPYLLERNIAVKVIEVNKAAAASLAVEFPQAEVVIGDGTSQSFLKEERIQNYDTVIALTNIDEENLLLSVFAGKLGAPRTFTKVNRTDLLTVLEPSSIDNVISPRLTIANRLIQFVRSLEQRQDSAINGYIRLADNQVEIAAFTVQAQSRLLDVPIQELRLQENSLIALIIRQGELIFPTGKDHIHIHDEVMIVTKTTQKIVNLDMILK